MTDFRTREPTASEQRQWLTTLMIVILMIGPTIALIGLALPHAPDADETGMVTIALASYLLSGTLALFRRRVPEWGLQAVVICGTLLISASIYFSGSTVSAGAFYYLWVVLGAAYFFNRRQLALQLIVVAVGYATALMLKPYEPGMVQTWILAVATLVVAAALFSITRERVAELVARLGQAADTDPLTGLLNRRGFSRQLELELDRAERFGSELSLISGDLDNFKQINDRFGHKAGDDVLVEVAQVFQRHARRIDCVARVGGEEFALLIPGADIHGAFAAAERVRHRIREAFAEHYPGLTISFGIASYPNDGETAEQLLRFADESLYAAKALGRDRSVVYSRDVVGGLAGAAASGTPDSASNLTTLLTLAEAVDSRDPGAARHSDAVGRQAERIARELGLGPDRVERIRLAGVLHDIGKVGISDSAMQKPGPLDDEEWEEIRTHPELGARLLSAPGFGDLRAWILARHERPDGNGYPFGLRGETIPLEARILAVAEAFEAIRTDRPYRRGHTEEEAIAELRRCSGTQFDPQVVEALVSSLHGSPAPRP